MTTPPANPIGQGTQRGELDARRAAQGNERLPGINLIGHATKNNSFGVTLRHIANSLLARGVPISVHDLRDGNRAQGEDDSLAPYVVQDPSHLPYDINLFCYALPDTPARIRGLDGDAYRWKDRLNVALVWWEIPQLPPHWIPALEAFDVLLCGSWFIRELLSFQVPGAMPLHFHYPLTIPEFKKVDRRSLGVPEDAYTFYFGFDPYSGLERKNPGAVLDAFRKAFSRKDPAHLVLKLNAGAEGGQRWPADASPFIADCKGDPQVTVIMKTGAYSEALGILDACCDCFVSLHRAEGLGMGPMEAMMLGKPVIQTAWSGSMSYSTPTSACLVPYEFTSPRGVTAHFFEPEFLGGRGRWAKPSSDSAAVWMRMLVDDRSFSDRIAAGGRAQITKYLDEAARCSFVEDLGNLLEMKRRGGLPTPGLDSIRLRIDKAESAHFGLKVQQAKRWLASHVPGMWGLFYG